MGYKEKLLLALGLLSVLFLFLIQDAVVPGIFTFSYLIAITRILTFFLFVGTVLAPLLVGLSLIKSKFYYTALFLALFPSFLTS
jgi:hypothetical protein